MKHKAKIIFSSLLIFFSVFSTAFAAQWCVSGTGSSGADGTYTDATPDAGATATAINGGFHLNDDGTQCYIMYGPYFGWTVGFYATTGGSCAGNFASGGTWQHYSSWASNPLPVITAGACSSPPLFTPPPVVFTSSIGALFTTASSTCVQTNVDHTATSTYFCTATSTQPRGVPYDDWLVTNGLIIFFLGFIAISRMGTIFKFK